MAGPHVVGVVALLWSARPEPGRDIAATKQLLTRSGQPGRDRSDNADGLRRHRHVPNNHFGYGRVDALAAYNADLIGTVPRLHHHLKYPDGDVTTIPAGSTVRIRGQLRLPQLPPDRARAASIR